MGVFSRFRKETEGATTIEFLFWIPVMVVVIAMTVDAVMLMNHNQTMFNLARDASRAVAVGAMTPSEAEDSLSSWKSSTGSTVTVVDDGSGFVTTTIKTPFSSAGNMSGLFLKGDLGATAVMWIEGGTTSGS